MERIQLLELTVSIVVAHAENNKVSVNDLQGVIKGVHAALADLEKAPASVAAKPVPAVSIKASVKPESITCLECGKKQRTLKRHLGTNHGLTPAEYRTKWGLADSYPMVAPAYSAQRSEMAKAIGLGRKRGQKSTAPARKSKLGIRT